MKTISVLLLLFLTVVLNMYLISWIFEFLSASNDIQVILGIVSVCLLVIGDAFIIRIINKKLF
jgi:hypothetical protein